MQPLRTICPALYAASLVASAAAFSVSLLRPLSNTVEKTEDQAGNMIERTYRDVLVYPLGKLPLWHVGAWLDDDTDPIGCLNILAFGCCVEVYYLRRIAPQSTN